MISIFIPTRIQSHLQTLGSHTLWIYICNILHTTRQLRNLTSIASKELSSPQIICTSFVMASKVPGLGSNVTGLGSLAELSSLEQTRFSTGDENFHLFPKLPVELRLIIWQMALPGKFLPGALFNYITLDVLVRTESRTVFSKLLSDTSDVLLRTHLRETMLTLRS